MRHRLIRDTFEELSNAQKVLRASASYTAQFWRNFERHQIEEYLAKILPRQYRNIIKVLPTDFRKLFKEKTYKVTERYLGDLFNTVLSTKPANSISKIELDERLDIENYTAMWLLRTYYSRLFTDMSARHLKSFKALLTGNTTYHNYDEPKNVRLYGQKRIAGILYDNPLNYALIQRIEEHQTDMISWINNQQIASSWRGNRRILINKLPIYQNTYSYNFLMYRLDLEIANPLLPRSISDLPVSVLPKPAGRNIPAPEVWELQSRHEIRNHVTKVGFKLADGELRLRQRQYGVADLLWSPVVPANCLYFKDLAALPDVMWVPEGDQPERHWGAFPIRSLTKLFMFNRHDVRIDYFSEVVMLFASVPLLEPIPANEFTRGERQIDLKEAELNKISAFESSDEDITIARRLGTKPNSELTKQLAEDSRNLVFGTPCDFFPQITAVLSNKLRKNLSGDPIPDSQVTTAAHTDFSNFQIADALEKRFGSPTNINIGSEEPEYLEFWREVLKSDVGDLLSHVCSRYHRVASDVRRGYCAIRIFEAEIRTLAEHQQRWQDPSRVLIPPNVSDRILHRHDDRFRLYGIEKLRRCFGMHTWTRQLSIDEQNNIVAHASNDQPNDPTDNDRPANKFERTRSVTRLYNSLDFDSLCENGKLHPFHDTVKLWKTEKAAILNDRSTRREIKVFLNQVRDSGDTLSELSSAGKYWFEGNTQIKNAKDYKFKEFVNPFIGTKRTKQRAAQEADRARTIRSGVMLLWGLGPSLSSLIHVDLMSEVYMHEKRIKRLISAAKENEKRLRLECKLSAEKLAVAIKQNEEKLCVARQKENKSFEKDLWRTVIEWDDFLVFAGQFALTYGSAAEQIQMIAKTYNNKSHPSKTQQNRNESDPNEQGSKSGKAKNKNKPLFFLGTDVSNDTLGIMKYDKGVPQRDGLINDVIMRIEIARYYLSDLSKNIYNSYKKSETKSQQD